MTPEIFGESAAPPYEEKPKIDNPNSELTGERIESRQLSRKDELQDSGDSSLPPSEGQPTSYRYLEWDTSISEILPHGLVPSEHEHNHPPRQLPSEFFNHTDPYTWSRTQRGTLTAICCYCTIVGAWAASGYAMGINGMIQEWGTSRSVLLVGITVFSIGFSTTPMITAPVSETYGRTVVMLSTYVLMILGLLATALAPNIGLLLFFRLMTGIGASSFSSLLGGMIADTHESDNRGLPMCIFASAGVIGMALGPFVSGFLAQYLGWRWIQWFQLILNGVLFIVMWISLKESRGSVLLQRRAIILNRWLDELEKEGETNELEKVRWRTKSMDEKASLVEMIKVSLTRPFVFLITEPVVFWFSVWLGFTWSMLFLFLASIQFAFARFHGFNSAQTGTVFIAIIICGLLAAPLDMFIFKAGVKKYPTSLPERRLYASCILGPLLPLGILMFGLTAHLHPAVPSIGIGITTIGIYSIFLCSFNYLADVYTIHSSSAMAAKSFARNALGGAFPVVGNIMYERIGVKRGSGILCGVGLALCAVPWILVKYGAVVRARSKYAAVILETVRRK